MLWYNRFVERDTATATKRHTESKPQKIQSVLIPCYNKDVERDGNEPNDTNRFFNPLRSRVIMNMSRGQPIDKLFEKFNRCLSNAQRCAVWETIAIYWITYSYTMRTLARSSYNCIALWQLNREKWDYAIKLGIRVDLSPRDILPNLWKKPSLYPQNIV